MSAGPFADVDSFATYVADLLARTATIPLAVLLPDGTPVGIATYLRVDHANGTAEVGNITYGSVLQRTTAATEAMYLMAAHAFDVVGVPALRVEVRRAQRSRRATPRHGSASRSRASSARPWSTRAATGTPPGSPSSTPTGPTSGARYERWLDPANFTEGGTQRTPLADLG